MSYLFHGQRTNEEVILFTKQHPLVLLHSFLIVALIWLVPLVVYLFTNSSLVLSWVYIVAILAGAVKGILAWYAWNNSVLLLTNERVVVLQQKSVLHREFSECNLLTIQQVSHEVKGLFGTMFGYGNLSISTGGSQTPFLIPNIPDPYEIQQEIQRSAVGEGFIEE